MIILIIVISTFFLSLLLVTPEIVKSYKKIPTLRNLSGEDRKKRIDKWLNNNPKFNKSISELQKVKPFITHHIWVMIKTISFIFCLPIFVFRMALSVRFGPAILWRFPFNIYDIWSLIFISLSFYYATIESYYISITLANIVLITNVYSIGSNFEKEDGRLKIFKVPEHKLHLSEIITEGLIVLLSFSSVYYSIDKLIPNSFSNKLSIFDSIYYSLMTGTTVGYGDIAPTSLISKSISMLEVIFGIFFLVVIISVFISVWLNRQSIIKGTNDAKNEN